MGNRGKRDRQIVLMTLLQKMMLDEKITANFELHLDFGDSLLRMVSFMVRDE